MLFLYWFACSFWLKNGFRDASRGSKRVRTIFSNNDDFAEVVGNLGGSHSVGLQAKMRKICLRARGMLVSDTGAHAPLDKMNMLGAW